MFGFFKKKKEVKIIDPVTDVKTLMIELGVPSWLQMDTITLLHTKQKTMSNEEILSWLQQMAMSENFIIPEEFQVEKELDLCFNTYEDWIESEINDFANLSYQDRDALFKNLPDPIQRMNPNAQKAYLAVSICILNIFSQIN